MELQSDVQEKYYANYWKKIEDYVSTDSKMLEMFFRLLTLAPVIEILPLVSISDLASILANLIGMQRYEKDFA